MSTVVVVPPDLELIREVTRLTHAYARLDRDDPLRADLAEAIRQLIWPRLTLELDAA